MRFASDRFKINTPSVVQPDPGVTVRLCEPPPHFNAPESTDAGFPNNVYCLSDILLVMFGQPNITGEARNFLMKGDRDITYTGCFYRSKLPYGEWNTTAAETTRKTFFMLLEMDASSVSSIYKNNSTVRPKSLTLNSMIKY